MPPTTDSKFVTYEHRWEWFHFHFGRVDLCMGWVCVQSYVKGQKERTFAGKHQIVLQDGYKKIVRTP